MANGHWNQTNATLDRLSDTEIMWWWTNELQRTKKYFQPYWDQCDRMYERYRDERAGNASAGRRTSEGWQLKNKRYNIFWSNVQTLFPALYNNPPQPVVSRRYKDDDPISLLTSEIIERCLQYQLDPPEDKNTYDQAARMAVLDYLLVGRGVCWYDYERETEEEVEQYEDGDDIVEEVVGERVVRECTNKRHIQYRDFMHSVAPTWDQVKSRGWAGIRHYFTRPELREFLIAKGESEERATRISREVKLTATDTVAADGTTSTVTDESSKKGKSPSYAEVWELWNVPNKKVYYITQSLSEPVLVEDDPLQLQGFFPCPRPLYATTTPNTLIPVPDYVEYYDQADNLDAITDKKWKLTTALRAAGIYAGNEDQTMQQLFDGSGRNIMIPVQDWAHVTGQGGVDGLWSLMDLSTIIEALRELQAQEEATKQQIYEITGIADIVRGQSKASETLGAQRIKGQWASVRISDRQNNVAEFCRNMTRLDGEIIATHYDRSTIAQMSNFENSDWAQDQEAVQAFDDAVQMMRNDRQRNFRTDVETEDTVFADQNQERAQNIEMLQGMASFMEVAGVGIQNAPETAGVWGEMLQIGVKQFTGTYQRRLEMEVDKMLAAIKDRMEEAEQNPQPTPEQIEAEQEQQKNQMQMQSDEADRAVTARGQVIDFKKAAMQDATDRRGQDLQFRSKAVSDIAAALSRTANNA